MIAYWTHRSSEPTVGGHEAYTLLVFAKRIAEMSPPTALTDIVLATTTGTPR